MKKAIVLLVLSALGLSAQTPTLTFSSWIRWGPYVYLLVNGDMRGQDVASLQVNGSISDARFVPASVESTPALILQGKKEVVAHFPNNQTYRFLVITRWDILNQLRSMPVDPALRNPADVAHNADLVSKAFWE